MPETRVSIQNVSKKFCQNLKRSLWYGVQDLGAELTGRRTQRKELRKDEFWALQGVSFDVKQGETIGLIGRNGAGKTTLLRLLSGLIKPDTGRIEVRGRLQALIALGAGFNPVLTGQENIYISAAVLGFSKLEIDKLFDEIVDFSGIGEFIDMPVQSYSSGMAVRLGFSVAVHLEPDILLVDEVLAVGDIPFRAKCHRKLGELKDKGVPWIMVSHDMGIIRNQTTKVIYLEKGKIKFLGDPEEAINQYFYAIAEEEHLKNNKSNSEKLAQQTPTLPDVCLGRVRFLGKGFQEQDSFQTGERLIFEINYGANQDMEKPAFGVYIYGGDGLCYIGTNTSIDNYHIENINGNGKIYYTIPNLPLKPGIYRVRVDIWDKHMGMRDKQNEAAYLHVAGGKFSAGMFYIPGIWSRDGEKI
ncbi:MAG: ABC transporter ATP-binding protein [Anaerolineales bacterium]|nr:ABC transporter ATP-binding protein [Anaerolineales bacterium]